MMRGMRKVDLAHVQLASSEVARDINRDVILEVIRAQQPVSRAELSRISGLQRSTVSLIVNQLIEERWVRDGAMVSLPRGRRPTMVGMNEDLVVLVADIRPKLATVAVMDLNGRFLARTQLPVTSGPERTIAAILEAMQRMRESHPEKSFEGVGVSLPGRVDASSRRLRFAPNLPWLGFDVKGAFERGTGLPVELDNEANACLLAEIWFGRMDGVRNAVLVSITEGVGTGLLANGQLLYGSDGMAGEYGHLPLKIDGPRCGCGGQGCWEMYASSEAALGYYAEGAANRSAGTIAELLELASQNDPDAVAALTRQAEYIGRGLRLVSASLAPEVILISGDIVSAWTRFGPVIEASFSASVLAGVKPRLVPTHESEVARLRGAAIVLLQRRAGHREPRPTPETGVGQREKDRVSA